MAARSENDHFRPQVKYSVKSTLCEVILSHQSELRDSLMFLFLVLPFILKCYNTWLFSFLPPGTKLGQGYIFTGACDSVHGGGGGLVRGVPGLGGSAPEGCLVETPPGQLLLRAVRILLECILVVCINFKTQFGLQFCIIFHFLYWTILVKSSVPDKKVKSYHASISIKHFSALLVGICYFDVI